MCDGPTFAKTEWITNGQFRATCNIGNMTQNGLLWTNCGPNVILTRYFIHHQCYVHGNYRCIIAHLCVNIYLCHVNVYNYLFVHNNPFCVMFPILHVALNCPLVIHSVFAKVTLSRGYLVWYWRKGSSVSDWHVIDDMNFTWRSCVVMSSYLCI
jgi:hypothetical protein